MLTLRAISVRCNNASQTIDAVADLPENLLCVRADWQEAIDALGGDEQQMRDLMLRSFCPEICGMHAVKLAVLLALSSGVNGRDVGQPTTTAAVDKTESGGFRGRRLGRTEEAARPITMHTRGNSHVILVGDPGLAKSKLLRFAAAASLRSVSTTGMGCSAAGLTATAVRENGEWQLEAGALVLADGGVCCIDEFNTMRESDKATIHEAMEQQAISIAKSGLVCRLKTRCAVVASTNPKNMAAMQASNGGATPVVIGIASPLLSRFDLVLVLRDEQDPEWDDMVATHLLECRLSDGRRSVEDESLLHPLWTVQQFQTHLTAIRDICPTVRPQASAVLRAYFRACRADEQRNQARTSVRLLDSLKRLASAHARLMFRDVVTEMDALTVVRLMESSWGFGRLLEPQDLLRSSLPFGPSADDVVEIRMRLGLPTTALTMNEPDNKLNSSPENVRLLSPKTTTTTNVPTSKQLIVEETTSVIDDISALIGAPLSRNHSDIDMFRDVHEPASQSNRTGDNEFTQTPLLTNRDFRPESSFQSNWNRFNASVIDPPITQTGREVREVRLTQAEMDDIMSWVDFDDGPAANVTDDVKMVIDCSRKRDQDAAELADNTSENPFKALKRSKSNILKNETIVETRILKPLMPDAVSNENASTSPDISRTQPKPMQAQLLCPQDNGNLDFLDDFEI